MITMIVTKKRHNITLSHSFINKRLHQIDVNAELLLFYTNQIIKLATSRLQMSRRPRFGLMYFCTWPKFIHYVMTNNCAELWKYEMCDRCSTDKTQTYTHKTASLTIILDRRKAIRKMVFVNSNWNRNGHIIHVNTKRLHSRSSEKGEINARVYHSWRTTLVPSMFCW